MSNRWLILAALTFARTVMGFQFQSVAAVAAPIVADFHIGYATLGTVIGLYLLPGVAVAIPGGVLAQRFGDKRTVLFGLAAMTLGGLMMASGDEMLLTAGRVLSGCGAVVLNVLLTKMTTDTFEGREVVTALGVLITSWPLGIALALVTLPRLAAASSWHAAMAAGAGLSALAFVLIAALYRPQRKPASAARLRFDLARGELPLAVLAGLVWAFYNMGLILVLTFGPAWLIAGGDTPAHASAVVSLVSWLILPALPLGAFFADRAGHPMTTMFSFFALGALAIALLPVVGGAPALLAAIGLIFGPPGGLIMALPGQAAPPERRALAMGVYFTVYYVGMGIAPGVAGFARDVSHSAAAPLWLAVAMLAFAVLSLIAFRALRRAKGAP